RAFQDSVHVNDVSRHPKILDVPSYFPHSRYQYLGGTTPHDPGRRSKRLDVLPSPPPRRRGTRWHGWMHFARGGFTLPFDGLFRLGACRTSASAAARRPRAVGAILSDEKSPLAGLGMGAPGSRHVG